MSKAKAQAIDQFAHRHHVRTSRDECGETIICGKKGRSHIFEYDEGVLGVAIMPKPDQTRTWDNARKAFEKVGMTITQNADREGIASFDPGNNEQVRLAKQYAGISTRKKATAAQLAALSRYRATKAGQKQRDHVQVSPEPQRSKIAA